MGASFIVEGQGGDNFSAIFRILKVMYFRDCPCASVQLNMTFFFLELADSMLIQMTDPEF
jgi:hypothetical protein